MDIGIYNYSIARVGFTLFFMYPDVHFFFINLFIEKPRVVTMTYQQGYIFLLYFFFTHTKHPPPNCPPAPTEPK